MWHLFLCNHSTTWCHWNITSKYRGAFSITLTYHFLYYLKQQNWKEEFLHLRSSIITSTLGVKAFPVCSWLCSFFFSSWSLSVTTLGVHGWACPNQGQMAMSRSWSLTCALHIPSSAASPRGSSVVSKEVSVECTVRYCNFYVFTAHAMLLPCSPLSLSPHSIIFAFLFFFAPCTTLCIILYLFLCVL